MKFGLKKIGYAGLLLVLLFSISFVVAQELEDQLEVGDEFAVDNLVYEVISDSEVAISGWENEEMKRIVIPDSITYDNINYSVVEIGEMAFSGCDAIEQVSLGNNIRTIRAFAFSECESLQSIYISPQVTGMEEGVFSGDEDITLQIDSKNTNYVYENGCLIQGERLIFADPAMEECQIPDCVKSIEAYAFQGCDYLSQVRIPDSVHSLKEGAFAECFGIERIHIEDNTDLELGTDAFGQMQEEGTIYVDTPAQKQLVESYPQAYPASVKVECAKNYQITYEVNGGAFSGTPRVNGNSSEDVELTEPSRKGYLFSGWCEDEACQQEPQFMVMAGNTENLTYYAKWEKEEEPEEEETDNGKPEEESEYQADRMKDFALQMQNKKTKSTEDNKTKNTLAAQDVKKEHSADSIPEQTEVVAQAEENAEVTQQNSVSQEKKEKTTIKSKKQVKQNETNPSTEWWRYILLIGSGILCVIAGMIMFISEKVTGGKGGTDTNEKNS